MFQDLHLIKDDEDSLVEHISSLWVLDDLVDVGELDKDVAMGHAPQHGLKSHCPLPKDKDIDIV